MINLRYFCFVVIQLYLKVRALALFYFINLHHYTYITKVRFQIHRDAPIIKDSDVSPKRIHRNSIKIGNLDVSSPSRSIKISNPRCHILPPDANLRANHSEPRLRGRRLRGKAGIFAGN